jgi:mRNA-degrading endonuclease RelE of RelBE toxin-antitoxin system
LPRLRFSRRAEELFHSLPSGAQATLDEAFLRLMADAHIGEELRGRLRGTWRLREGGYRILYKVREGGRLVVVESIRLRRDAYR